MVADFAGATSAPDQTVITFQDFDRPVPKRKTQDQILGFAQQATVATVTPITAGLQDLVPALFQRPWRPSSQQVTTNAPAAVSLASTPTTAGLQDLAPWLFAKPFKASLQQDHALAPFGYVTGTPTASGLQDFGALLKKGFKATLQQLDAITSTGTFVLANTPITSGLQDFGPLFKRPFKAALQQQELISPSGTYVPSNTPITGGIQGFDFRFQKSFNTSLQSVGSFGAAVITYAVTPTEFSFGLLDMKALRQAFPAYQQQFAAAQMYGDVPAPPISEVIHNFPFIANVGTMMQRW